LGVGTIMGILWSSFASGAHAASSMTAAKPTILGSNAVNNFAGAFPTLRVVSTALLLVSSFGGVLLQLALRQLQYGAAWYMTQLALYPVLTKSATAALIGYIGDYMAQWLEYKLEQNHQKGVIGGGSCDGTQHHHKISLNSSNSRVSARSNLSIHGTYDLRRGLSIMTDGLLISGPLMHFGYAFFEHLVPVSTSPLAAMLHVIADSILLDSIFVATTFLVTGLFEGYRWQHLSSHLRSDYSSTLKASWGTSLALMPLEFVCFRYLPVSLRVLAVNFIDVVWDAVISFMVHRKRKSRQVTTESLGTATNDAVLCDEPTLRRPKIEPAFAS
jgi:hypothetical protein